MKGEVGGAIDETKGVNYSESASGSTRSHSSQCSQQQAEVSNRGCWAVLLLSSPFCLELAGPGCSKVGAKLTMGDGWDECTRLIPGLLN